MRLAKFILANIEPILVEWEAFATNLPSGASMTKLALRDHAQAILLASARDMEANQSLAQQAGKSKGHGGADTIESDQLDIASAQHAEERVGAGFDIIEVVSEYRALRAIHAPINTSPKSAPTHGDHDNALSIHVGAGTAGASPVSSLIGVGCATTARARQDNAVTAPAFTRHPPPSVRRHGGPCGGHARPRPSPPVASQRRPNRHSAPRSRASRPGAPAPQATRPRGDA